MSGFAARTQVSVGKSRNEIEELLLKAGATGFVSGWDSQTGRHVIEFKVPALDSVRVIRLEVPLPGLEDREVTHTPTGNERDRSQRDAVWDQLCRQRWRQMKLILQAKLEAIEVGITTIEREFLADLVMPNGQTLSQVISPQLNNALQGTAQLSLTLD